MNDTLELADLEAEPFEIESTTDEFGQGETGGDFEYSEEADGEFEQEITAGGAQQAGRAALSMQSGQVQQALQRRRAVNTNFVKAIGTLNKYVVKRDGVYRFNLPVRSVSEAASKLGLPPKMVQLLLGSLKHKNARLRAARVTQAELEIEAPSCAGRSALENFWWGRKVYLDECQSKSFIAALKGAAAGGGGCAALVPHPIVKAACAAFGALSGVSAYGLEAIDSAGGNQGLIIYWPWIGGGWAWHQ
jgi:hypothetical protein